MSKHSTQYTPILKPCPNCQSEHGNLRTECQNYCGRAVCDLCSNAEQMCRECAPACPTCGEETTFTHWSDATDEWLVCDKCGAKTDEVEVAS